MSNLQRSVKRQKRRFSLPVNLVCSCLKVRGEKAARYSAKTQQYLCFCSSPYPFGIWIYNILGIPPLNSAFSTADDPKGLLHLDQKTNQREESLPNSGCFGLRWPQGSAAHKRGIIKCLRIKGEENMVAPDQSS